MMSFPLISIPLCTFNGATFLRQQLDSLLQQSVTDIEIVAVDDGSTDETVAILQDYARVDHRVHVFVQERNVGFRRNFEYALSLCRGRLVAPSDQDDVWHRDKLEILLQGLGSYSMVYCDSLLVDTQGKSLGMCMSDKLVMSAVRSPLSFLTGNCVSGHAMLFSRQLLQQALPIPEGWFHDWWLAAVATLAEGVAFVDRPLVSYRQHDANVTDVLKQRSVPAAPGAGASRTQTIRQRMVDMAALPGEHRPYVRRLLQLWDERNGQWFSPLLVLHMMRHAGDVFLLTRKSWLGRQLAPFKYLVGLRLKRILRPEKYQPD